MGVIRKSSFPANLDQFNVFEYDTDRNSRYFKITQFPDTFTGGKNAFLIQGSNLLRENSFIYIEVKDSAGNVIYSEPAGGKRGDYYEGLSIPVSVRVYDDTTFGPATVTIVGELKQYYDDFGNLQDMPDEWVGRYNVMWQRTVAVNPFLPNTTPIRFYKKPKIKIEEILLNVYERFTLLTRYSGSFKGVSIDPPPGTEWPFAKPVRYEIFSINPKSASFSNPNVSPSLVSTAPIPFTAESKDTVLEAKNILFNTATSSVDFADPDNWRARIKKIISPFRAIVDFPYVSNRKPNLPPKIQNIELGKFELFYESSSVIVSDTLSSSYATIRLEDIDTFSGDLHRVKVFARSKNDLQGFSLLEDIVLENREMLRVDFDKDEGKLNKSIGDFTPKTLQKYWVTQSLAVVQSHPMVIKGDKNLTNSVIIQPSNDVLNTNGLVKLVISSSMTASFVKDYEYKLDFSAVYISGSNNLGILDVYMSGSVLDNNGDFTIENVFNNTDLSLPYGKKIATYTTNTFQRYDDQSVKFLADNAGPGYVSFVVRNGIWEISNVSLSPASETAYSPAELQFLVKPNVQVPNEAFDFRFEFFDVNYTAVPLILQETIRFGGGNDILPKITFNLIGQVGIRQNWIASLSANRDRANEGGFNGVNGFFLISSNSFDATPESLSFVVDARLCATPFTFDSSSGTAYDRSGSAIQMTDVATGFNYPGQIIFDYKDGIEPAPGTTGKDIYKIIVKYEDFRSKIIGLNEKGEYRQVDFISYNINDELGRLANANMGTSQLKIGTDWRNYLRCDPGRIEAVDYNIWSPIDDSVPATGVTQEGQRDILTIGATNFPGLDNISRSFDEWVIWWRPEGATNWYYGYHSYNYAQQYASASMFRYHGTNQIREEIIGRGSVYNGLFISGTREFLTGSVYGRSNLLGQFVTLSWPTSNTATSSIWYNATRDFGDLSDNAPPPPPPPPPPPSSGGIEKDLSNLEIVDAWERASLVGIELLAVEARVVIASVDTYIKYACGYDYDTTTPRPSISRDAYIELCFAERKNATPPGLTFIDIYIPHESLIGKSYVDVRIAKRCHGSLYIDNPNTDPEQNKHIFRYSIFPELRWNINTFNSALRDYDIKPYDSGTVNQNSYDGVSFVSRRLPWKRGYVVAVADQPLEINSNINIDTFDKILGVDAGSWPDTRQSLFTAFMSDQSWRIVREYATASFGANKHYGVAISNHYGLKEDQFNIKLKSGLAPGNYTGNVKLTSFSASNSPVGQIFRPWIPSTVQLASEYTSSVQLRTAVLTRVRLTIVERMQNDVRPLNSTIWVWVRNKDTDQFMFGTSFTNVGYDSTQVATYRRVIYSNLQLLATDRYEIAIAQKHSTSVVLTRNFDQSVYARVREIQKPASRGSNEIADNCKLIKHSAEVVDSSNIFNNGTDYITNVWPEGLPYTSWTLVPEYGGQHVEFNIAASSGTTNARDVFLAEYFGNPVPPLVEVPSETPDSLLPPNLICGP